MFVQRNPVSSVLAGKIDLHGLHVEEAVECITELIHAKMYGSDFIEESYFGALKLRNATRVAETLNIITGSGHHSQGHGNYKPRILPAIQELFESWELDYNLVKDVNGFVGSIRVGALKKWKYAIHAMPHGF